MNYNPVLWLIDRRGATLGELRRLQYSRVSAAELTPAFVLPAPERARLQLPSFQTPTSACAPINGMWIFMSHTHTHLHGEPQISKLPQI